MEIGGTGVETGGSDRNGVDKRGLTKQSSGSNLLSGTTERFCLNAMNVSRVNALGAMVNRHSDAIVKALLTSKESSEKRTTIESAFRACRDAFVEVSAVLINMLEGGLMNSNMKIEEIRKVVGDELDAFGRSNLVNSGCCRKGDGHSSSDKNMSYAAAVNNIRSEIKVQSGPIVELDNTTSFLIEPEEGKLDRFTSSQVTKETLCKVLKPADCGLRIKRLSFARNRAVRIVAISPDIEKIRTHPGLVKAGLRVTESVRMNPRIIVHGVPVGMTDGKIEEEIIAQNLEKTAAKDVKVVYTFRHKTDKWNKSCILEVSPAVRRTLFNNGRIFIGYAACSFADHVRIVQCFRCLSFGHIAKDCKSEPHCGHCAGGHEMKNCTERGQQLKCYGCIRQGTLGNYVHTALDAKKCPILGRKIKDKIADINYG